MLFFNYYFSVVHYLQLKPLFNVNHTNSLVAKIEKNRTLIISLVVVVVKNRTVKPSI